MSRTASAQPSELPRTGALMGDPPTAAATPAQARARFFNSGNAFNLKLAAVPRARFDAARDAAMAGDAATGSYAMDQSAALGCGFPATTPLVLARYLRVNPGEALATGFAASGEVHYVIAGNGETRIEGETAAAGETMAWGPGDVMVLPGGGPVEHRATGPDAAILWTVTNEPALAFERLCPPAPGTAAIDPVHYPAAEIDRQVAVLQAMPMAADQAGVALIFSGERTADSRNAMPSLTLALNTLPPGEHQRAPRHNAAAITLCIEGEGCFSTIDGHRIDWSPFSTMVTPPGEVHSHHNGGPRGARFLIVQDGGWHYHARTMGFAFAE
jgi:gentisate 1,2-dioxygenase